MLLIRISIALLWAYQGLWCKLLRQAPSHAAIVGQVPLLRDGLANALLLTLGAVECALAAWVLLGRWPVEAALAQTLTLAAMNAGGLLWARQLIPDPLGMLFQNFSFALLIWVASGVLPYGRSI